MRRWWSQRYRAQRGARRLETHADRVPGAVATGTAAHRGMLSYAAYLDLLIAFSIHKALHSRPSQTSAPPTERTQRHFRMPQRFWRWLATNRAVSLISRIALTAVSIKPRQRRPGPRALVPPRDALFYLWEIERIYV